MNATIECYQCGHPTTKKYKIVPYQEVFKEMWFCSTACQYEYSGINESDGNEGNLKGDYLDD